PPAAAARSEGTTRSGSECTSAGIRYKTQCTQGTGRGASGSSTISANSFTPAVGPDQLSEGEIFSPSSGCLRGITWSLTNASLLTSIRAVPGLEVCPDSCVVDGMTPTSRSEWQPCARKATNDQKITRELIRALMFRVQC